MIQYLKIKNFQSHERSKLEFHNGVNVIVGHSDAGKSAIIRALRWLIWNRPSGDTVRSNWGGETSVEMGVDGNVITRYKDKMDKYQIQQDGQTLDFKAIGTSVPEEVAGLLNVNEINLQLQLDRPFLLSDSPGEVASHFNKVAHLEKIDSSISNVNSTIRSLEQDITYKTAEIEKQEEALKQFEHLDKFEAEVEVLEQMENKLKATNRALVNILELIFRINQAGREIESYQELITDEDEVTTVLDLYKQKEEKEKLLIEVNTILQNIAYTDKVIRDIQETVKDESTVNNLLELYGKRKTANETLAGLSKLLLRFSNIKGLTEAEQAELARLEALFKKELGVMKVCPTCGQLIK